MTPQHCLIEMHIRETEKSDPCRGWSAPERLAALNADRARLYADHDLRGDDPRAIEVAVYMYARRAGHWALEAMGERGPDRLASYYRKA